jgi:hypothetical protein
MSLAYATILDSRYLSRGLTVYASIARHEPSALFVLYCMDDLAATLARSLALPNCRVFTESEFAPEALRNVRPQRSVAEYCWTSKPFVLAHLLSVTPSLEWVAYLDSDMMTFGDLGGQLLGVADADFMLSPHRFSDDFAHYAPTVGGFNAGFAAFRNSAVGNDAIAMWSRLCLESCSVAITETTYADQRYLDDLIAAFPSGCASDHPGLNAAPWNIGRYRVTEDDGAVLLDGWPLLLYHYQGLHLLHPRWVDLYAGDLRLDPTIRRLIYDPYLRELSRSYRRLRDCRPGFDLGFNFAAPKWHSFLHHVKRTIEGQSNLVRAQLYS